MTISHLRPVQHSFFVHHPDGNVLQHTVTVKPFAFRVALNILRKATCLKLWRKYLCFIETALVSSQQVESVSTPPSNSSDVRPACARHVFGRLRQCTNSKCNSTTTHSGSSPRLGSEGICPSISSLLLSDALVCSGTRGFLVQATIFPGISFDGASPEF